ncbi:hypothetical protein [Psychrobacillus sp. FSL K6-1267]|uniref:hypothetical protein n=1 Tax=Psychrobacillus sp. FSL K6-1267 TaxID=2921543 RepID=UPI0030F5B534
MKIKFYLTIVIVLLLVLSACTNGSPGNPSAKDILKSNKDADILQYNGLIYENVENYDYLTDLNHVVKIDEIGEVKETKESYRGFNDFSASKLPVGSKVFSTSEEFNYFLIIELNEEDIIYTVILEG